MWSCNPRLSLPIVWFRLLDFARHYSRNHGCFLFLRVLRWFTSPGSLPTPMCSAWDTDCSQSVGSPIRTSPDHSVLTAPRSFSQLATSFFAFLCPGIPTHALSSLTIKFPVAPAPLWTPLRLPPSPPAEATRFRARFHPKESTLWKSSFPIHIGLVLKLSERAFPLLAPSRPRSGFPHPVRQALQA